jgi:hypothetical protein
VANLVKRTVRAALADLRRTVSPLGNAIYTTTIASIFHPSAADSLWLWQTLPVIPAFDL